jgi:hypothetical protein
MMISLSTPRSVAQFLRIRRWENALTNRDTLRARHGFWYAAARKYHLPHMMFFIICMGVFGLDFISGLNHEMGDPVGRLTAASPASAGAAPDKKSQVEGRLYAMDAAKSAKEGKLSPQAQMSRS